MLIVFPLFFAVLNINGNLVQLSGAPQATTNATVTQPAVTSPTQTVVPQTALASASNQLAMANGNIVMVRNTSDVRNVTKFLTPLFREIQHRVNMKIQQKKLSGSQHTNSNILTSFFDYVCYTFILLRKLKAFDTNLLFIFYLKL